MYLKATLLFATLSLAGCVTQADNGANLQGSGPGEVTFAGLTYDVRPGRGFVGLPQTMEADMPMTGSANFNGVLRGNVNGTYEDGTSALLVDFAQSSVVASGSVDFKGQGGIGVITFNETAAINGINFENSSTSTDPATDATVFGKFYGTGATVAAGTVAVPVAQGNHFIGAFIASR